MIIVSLKGGLGNQMFQYAAGRRLANKHNTNLKLDISWFDKQQAPDSPSIREFELDCFKLKPVFAKRFDLARIQMPPNNFKRRVIRKLFGPIEVFREADTADFLPEVLNAPNNSYLEGYWQSDEYFKDITNIIREDFTFRGDFSEKSQEIVKLIVKVNSVSLHVRRGDYVTHAQFTEVHGMTNLEYYDKAVKELLKKVKDPHFFIFSDDPEWCKKNIKLDYPVTYVDHNKKGADDMRLMSLCKHNIIANSTFSWWGAWLNINKGKVVIAPKRWFNDPSMSIEKRWPESWIKI